MSSIIIILIFITIVLCFLQYLLFYTPNGRLFNKIPGPSRLPIIGNVLDFFVGPVEMFLLPRKFSKRFKKTYGVQVVHTRAVNVFNPNDAEIILSSFKHITKGRIYTFLHPWLQQGLLTSKGEKWHQRRKILTPAFHFNILRQFCKSFVEQSQHLIEHLKSQNSDTVDVIPVVTQFALHSICETAMGTQVKAGEDANFDRYKRAIYDMGHLLLERLIRFWIHPDLSFRMTKMYAKQKETLSILHDFTTSVIRQRRKERQKGDAVQIISNEEIESEDYIKSSKKRLAMLDLLLSAEAEGKIDETGIREEVDTFMFEGHDTTAMGISFALMILANHKDVQDKIMEELNDIFEDPDRLATMEDLNNMRYLEMCIKESLRLYPSVPFISRRLEEEVQLTDYLIPPQTTCHIHIYDLHRDASIYPSPEEYNPERFNVENSSKRHPFAYIPFSAGPRNCIGQKFAMYEMKSVISSILRNFILEPMTKPNDLVFMADLVLRSKNPIYVKFIPRVIK